MDKMSDQTPMWHVVCDRYAVDPQPDETIWTVNRVPTETGWETDNGCYDYGITKANAQFLADAANEKMMREELLAAAREWKSARTLCLSGPVTREAYERLANAEARLQSAVRGVTV